MLFGKITSANSVPLKMYSKDLDVVNEYKYLGVTVVGGDTITFSTLPPLMRFRCSANTILNAPTTSMEMVSMKLLFTICVPNLTYACEALNYTNAQFQPMNDAIDNCLRKIFGYNRWESVRYLRETLGYPSLTEIFHSRSRTFYNRMPFLKNATLTLLNLFSFDKE